MKLDKFYTKKEIAKDCYNFLTSKFDLSGCTFLEPSAGAGAFLDYLPNYEAYDILPEDDRITQLDFLTFSPKRFDYITIGNPPFGKRSNLAISFFNKCATCSNIIAFVLPVSFLKYNTQKRLDSTFKLVFCKELPDFSFLDRGKDFSVNSVFQIWVRENSRFDIYDDIRLKKSPPITCDDFEIWQYNATESSFNVVNEDWEIALYRQGYHDYNTIFTQKDKESIKEKMSGEKKQQFFFIKPKNKEIENKIRSLDFNKLASRNTSTPGFGKADFVSYYEKT